MPVKNRPVSERGPPRVRGYGSSPRSFRFHKNENGPRSLARVSMTATSFFSLPFGPFAAREREIKPRVWTPQTEGTIMKISDIRTRIESDVDDQNFLATKSDELELATKTDELEKAPVLTLVDIA